MIDSSIACPASVARCRSALLESVSLARSRSLPRLLWSEIAVRWQIITLLRDKLEGHAVYFRFSLTGMIQIYPIFANLLNRAA
jgi:hypothetical protein